MKVLEFLDPDRSPGGGYGGGSGAERGVCGR